MVATNADLRTELTAALQWTETTGSATDDDRLGSVLDRLRDVLAVRIGGG